MEQTFITKKQNTSRQVLAGCADCYMLRAVTAAKQRYRNYMQSPLWKAKSKRIKELSGNKCSRCGASNHPLMCHHLHYFNAYGNESTSPGIDCICVCSFCHSFLHHGGYDPAKYKTAADRSRQLDAIFRRSK